MANYAEFRAAVERRFLSEGVTELLVHVLPRHFGADNPLSCP
jgi:hypothetical protein